VGFCRRSLESKRPCALRWGAVGRRAVLPMLAFSCSLALVVWPTGVSGASDVTAAGSSASLHPAAAIWPGGPTSGQIDVFWKGSGTDAIWEGVYGEIGYMWGWRGPDPVPQTSGVVGSPAVAVNSAFGQEEVFWRNQSNQLQEVFWDQSGWHSEGVIPSEVPLDSDPAVAVWPSGTRNQAGEQDVFWNKGGKIWETRYADGRWTNVFQPVSLHGVQGGPAVVVNAKTNEEDLFWRGTDNFLWEARYNGHWEVERVTAPGGSAFTLGSDPTVSAWPDSGQLDVFWKGYSDNDIWEAIYDAGTGSWRSGEHLAPGKATGAPTAGVDWPLYRQELFFKGTDNHLWEGSWYPGHGWELYELPEMGQLG
jgi:hypothetical protein